MKLTTQHREQLIREITDHLNGDQDVLAIGWEQYCSTEELQELHETLIDQDTE